MIRYGDRWNLSSFRSNRSVDANHKGNQNSLAMSTRHSILFSARILWIVASVFFSGLPLHVSIASVAGKNGSPPARLQAIDVSKENDRLVITIRTDSPVSDFKAFTLDAPARIVVDLFGIRSPYRKEQSIPVNSKQVQRIRHYGDSNRLRVVVETLPPYPASFETLRRDGALAIIVKAPDAAAPETPKAPSPEPKAVSPQEPVSKPMPVPTPPTPPAGGVSEKQRLSEQRRKDMVRTEIPDPGSIVGKRLDSPDGKLPPEKFSLQKTIDAALSANLEIKILEENTQAAIALKARQKTFFLPTLGAKYSYLRNDERPNIGGFAAGSLNDVDFSTTVRQPLFTGFSLINQYKISGLGLDIAKFNEKLHQQDVILQAKSVYYNLLKARKLVEVAHQTVEQITAQREVAKNYYQVGMTPLNDFLQAQVELANAKQDLVVARNNLETAVSDFNTLLRRPINAPVDPEDTTAHTPFGQSLEYCQRMAEQNRLETQIAALDIHLAEKELELAKGDFYPSIDLQGTYFRSGDNWTVDGGEGVFDPEGWNIGATATWDFWQWGRTRYGVKEKISRVNQARYRKDQLLDQIRQQVKAAYLKNLETEINIVTIQTAIEQAEENLRINQERFKEQVSTSTDVLIAQTLLTRTMTNYYNALYDFKISKAALYRAMGMESPTDE